MKLNRENVKKQMLLALAVVFFAAGTFSASAQTHKMHKKHDMQNKQSMTDQQVKDMQSENEADLVEIYRLTDGYPMFSYEYVYDNGKLKEVTVEGINDAMDRDKVASLIYDIRTNYDMMKNYCDAEGVYYLPEKDAKPTIGYEEFRKEIKENLEYPEKSKDYGVEGTVYVKFVVDENGNIKHMRADEAIDSSYDYAINKLKKAAIDAVEETDAKWEPAEVAGVNVDSWVVVPVTFEFKKDPSIPYLIR
jgi:TonB family protein